MLNSERIEATFGSYGVQADSCSEALRVSHLFSRHGQRRVTRTLALVQFEQPVPEALREPHGVVVDQGSSLGATLQAHGERGVCEPPSTLSDGSIQDGACARMASS